MPTGNGSSLSSLSDADLVSMLNAGGAPAPAASAQPANANPYTNAIGSNESNNAPDSAAIVNPASGARSSMQVMPNTANNPGFGVTPSNGTPQDDARMGRDYYNALLTHYQDPTTAAVAYDWGPGNTDKWLKNGGDLSKLPNETLAYALNFNGKTGAGQAASAQVKQPAGSGLPSAQFDQFLKANPNIASGTAAPASQGSVGQNLEGAAAGLGRGVQSAALGAQALVGKGLQAAGANNVGNWLVNDAQSGNAKGEQDFQAAGGNTIGGTVGKIAGEVAPALLLGPEALPQIAGAATMGAGNAALNNQNIAQGTVEGAGMGALGVAGGHALAGIAGALSPAASRLMAALRGGDNVAAANIAKQLQPGEVQEVIDSLRTNAQSPIANVQRTAAEAADNPTITKIQRAAQNTPEGQSAITGQLNANNAARMQAGQDAVGPSANNASMMGPGLDAEQQAFTQSQAQRIAQGQTELSPVDTNQAATMQTPEYQRAINGARRSAANSSQTAFEDQSATINQGLADRVDQLAGTPDTLEQARAARSAQGNADYAGVTGDISADTPAFSDLQVRPGFNQALRRAAGIQDNMEGSAAADALTQAPATRALQMDPQSGELNWVEQPGARSVDAGILQGARSQLSSMANKAAQAGDAAEAKGYRDTLAAVDNFLGSEQHAGPDIAQAFNRARANYFANSVPIDQQTFLQSKLAGAVNNLTGEVNPGALNSTLNSVAKGQLKPGLRPEDRITPEQLAEAQSIGQAARAAPTNMQGLSPQGQELIRQQLAQNSTKSADAQRALDTFNQYLAGASPGYAAHAAAEGTTGAALSSRQALSGALDKMSEAAHNASGQPNLTYTGAKSALRNADLSGVQAEYANNLLEDLQRSTAANAPVGAAGSQTSANEAMKGDSMVGGLLARLGKGTTLDAALMGGEAGGHLGAVTGILAQKLLGGAVRDAQAKTVASTIALLRDPIKLASALEKYKNSPQAATAFINALKTKALKAGKAGAVAVQAYEAATR